jgi:hypothetical protein
MNIRVTLHSIPESRLFVFNFVPGLEYKRLGEFRDVIAAKQPSRTYAGM